MGFCMVLRRRRKKTRQAIQKMKLLFCLLHNGRFSKYDVKKGRYFPSTGICRACYKRMQAQPYNVCCFGKPTKVVKPKSVQYGWDKDAIECKSECPDRQICKVFVTQKSKEGAFEDYGNKAQQQEQETGKA